MTTIITRTIGATGRDYASFAAAEADVANIATSAIGGTDLVSNDGAIVFEADAGTYVEILNVDSTLVSDATRNVTYRCADRAARPVIGNGTQSTTVRMRDDFTHFDGIDSFDTNGGAFKLFDSQVGLVIENCEATSDGAGVYLSKSGANIGSAAAPCVVRNVVTKARFGVTAGGADLFVEVFNCTFLPGTTTPAGQTNYTFSTTGSSDCKLSNCIVLDSRADRQFQATATVTGSNNIGVAGSTSPFRFSTNGVGSEKTPTTDTTPSAGDWSIFDASTGALVNVPANDAVGVGTASGAPTTDIQGLDRIRDTHVDPGAFTTNLLTLTKSIDGGGGGDYTTFTAAEAATTAIVRSADLVKENTAIVFEAEAGTYSETFIIDSQSASLVTDATRNVTYTYASGAYHGGSSGAGVKISGTASVIRVLDPHTVLDGLEVVGTATNSGSVIWAEGYGYNGSQYRNLLVWSGASLSDSTGGNFAAIRQNNPIASYTPTTPMVIENTVFNSTNFGITVRSSASDNGFDVVIRNCTTTDSVRFLTDGGDGSVPTGGASKSVALHNNLDNSTGGLLVGANTGVTGTATNVFNDGTLPPALRAGNQNPTNLWQFTTNTAASSTGDQVIYTSSTGAMVNVSGNDAIGVGDASNAPTTDIQGLNRIRATHVDPGAFTTDLLTATKTIGATGRDYTTFILAEGDINAIGTSALGGAAADLVANNGAIVFEADAGTYADTIFDSGPATDARDPIRTVTFKAAPGSESNGIIGTGVTIECTAGAGRRSDPYLIFDSIDIRLAVVSNVYGPRFEDNILLKNCVIDWQGSQRDGIILAATGLEFENCVIRGNSTFGGRRTIMCTSTSVTCEFRNCTLEHTNNNVVFGLDGATGHEVTLKNCIIRGTGVSTNYTDITFFGPANNVAPFGLDTSSQAGGQTWTFTTDDTASSTGSQVVYDDNTGQLYDVSGNDAWHYLTDLTNAPAIAIDGLTRDASGFNPGAFEESAGGSLPSQVTTGTPVSGSINVPLDQDLSWASATGASGYDVYFGVGTPSSLVSEDQVGLTYDPGTLAEDTTYAWRVDSKNVGGTTTGVEFTFTTLPPFPDQVTTGTPLSGAVGVSRTQNISWDPASGAASYNIYFGTTTNPPLVSNKTGTSYNPGLLDGNTVYYWRVDSVNSAGVTTGIEFSFRTVIVVGPVVAGIPASGAVDVPLNQELSWSATENATSYNVYFGTSANPTLVASAYTGTSYTPFLPLNYDKEYYWRVDAARGPIVSPGTSFEFASVNFQYNAADFIVAHDYLGALYEDVSAIHGAVQTYHDTTLPARYESEGGFNMTEQGTSWGAGLPSISGFEVDSNGDPSAIVFGPTTSKKSPLQQGPEDISIDYWKFVYAENGLKGVQYFFSTQLGFDNFKAFTGGRLLIQKGEIPFTQNPSWQTNYKGAPLGAPTQQNQQELSLLYLPSLGNSQQATFERLEQLVADLYTSYTNNTGDRPRISLRPYFFTESLWRHGPVAYDPDYSTPNRGGRTQLRLKIDGTTCPTSNQYILWDSSSGPPPTCLSAGGVELLPNSLFEGTGYDLLIKNRRMKPSSQWPINNGNGTADEDPITGVPIEQGSIRYPKPGALILNNINMSGVDENGNTTTDSNSFARLYDIDDFKVFNSDWGRNWYQHALYVSTAGNALIQSTTFNELAGKAVGFMYRCGAGGTGPDNNNSRRTYATTQKLKDCHIHNAPAVDVLFKYPREGEEVGEAGPAWAWNGFSVEQRNPGNSQFPGYCIIEDCSIINKFSQPFKQYESSNYFAMSGKLWLVFCDPGEQSDYYWDIYSMPSETVNTASDLAGVDVADQKTVKVLDTGRIWFWPEGSLYDQANEGGTTSWIEWEEAADGYPVAVCRMTNTFVQSAGTDQYTVMRLDSAREIIFDHNLISYDSASYPNTSFQDSFRVKIDSHGQNDFNGISLATSSVRFSNNIGERLGGGNINFEFYVEPPGQGCELVYTYNLTETNNIGRTVTINKTLFPDLPTTGQISNAINVAMQDGVLRTEGQADQGGIDYDNVEGQLGSNQTWFNDFFIDRPYDTAIDGPYPTAATGSGPKENPPSSEDPPSPPTGPYPEDNATGVYTDVTTLRWNPNGAVDNYRVFLGTDENSLLSVTIDPITDNFYDPGDLDESTQYFWRVDATNEYGTTSSNVFTFTTNGPAPPAPGLPVNRSPEVGSVDVSTSPYLIWQAPEVTLNQGAASGYDVFFDTSDNWIPSNPPRIAQDVTTTIVGPVTNEGSPLEYSTEYTWRVDAKNISGETSSGEWTFTTEDAPLPPGTITVFIPEANATGVDIGQTLSWEAPTSGGPIDDYRVYFATDAEWAAGASLVATVPGNITSWTPSEDLEYSTVYRWSVITRGPGGSGMAPGNRIFTTQPFPDPPGEVTDRSPSANEVDVSVYQSLSWEAPTTGGPLVDYALYFDTVAAWDPGPEPGDTNPVILPSNTTSWQPPTMDLSTVYRWAIISRGPEEITNPGNTIFTTEDGIDPPGTPSGLTPSANATGVAANQTLSWEVATPGGPITEYDVYLGTSATGPSLVSTQQTLVYTPEEDFEYLGVYVWKIVAKGPGGQAETALSYFTVEAEPEPPIDPPGSVTQGAPNNQSDIPINGTSLVWTAAPDAEVYEVFFDASSPANTSLSSNITGTVAGARDLSSNTTYYWRVDASNTAGVTTGTEFSFSTVIILNPPDAVTEGSPNNVTNVSIDPTLSWGAAQGALSYKIYLDEGSANPETLIGTTTGNTSLPVPNSLVNDTSYSWRVDAENSDGTTTGTVFTFSTIELNPPGQVTTGIPNGVLGYTINPTLSWEVPSTGGPITSYNVYLGVSGEALNLLGSNTETSFSILGLNYSTDYIWRVDALGPDGTTPGTEFSFTTIDPPTNDPPNQVVNLNPLNNSEDVSVNPVLVWSDVENITGYDVYFGATPSPSLVSENQQENFFIPEEAVAYDETFYWRVDSRNSAGTTEGVTWSFTTQSSIAPPPPPSPPSPERVSVSGFDINSYVSRNRNYETRENDIREKIFKMTQAKQNISFVYRDSLRAMISSFNDLGYISVEDEYKEIKCLHANAERAIAKLKEEENIVLPIVTISQTTTANDDSRRRQESILINEKVWDKEKNRAFRVLSLAPRPVNISYQVNVWCKYMADMDQVLEQIRLKFNPEMNVSTQNSTLAKAYLDTEEDIGSVTAGDKEDRIIKKTFNVVFRTYVPNPKFLVTSTGKIEEFITEVDLS